MKYLKISLIIILFLVLAVQSFPLTRAERLAGVKTEEQLAIEELQIEVKKLKEKVDNLEFHVVALDIGMRTIFEELETQRHK
jgi:cell division protein FtsB